MTIKQLAEKAGISQNTLYSITKRDSQKVDKVLLLKIAAALNCDVDWLQTGMKNEEFATGLKRVSEAAKGAQELAASLTLFNPVANSDVYKRQRLKSTAPQVRPSSSERRQPVNKATVIRCSISPPLAVFRSAATC